MTNFDNLNEIFDDFLSACENALSCGAEENAAVEHLITLVKSAKKNSAKGKVSATKASWSEINTFVINNFFANDSLVPCFQETQRALRLQGFLDSSNHIK